MIVMEIETKTQSAIKIEKKTLNYSPVRTGVQIENDN